MATGAARIDFRTGPAADDGRMLLVVVVLAIEVGLLVAGLLGGAWLVDGAGRIQPGDYVNFHAAGRLALDGQAAAAYDHAAHKAAGVRAIGHDFDGVIPWPYPPLSFLVVAPFATLPYLPSFGLWIVATGCAYLAAIRSVAGPGALVLVGALAWPASGWNISVGQNGFLTAALLAVGLGARDRRPLVAGLCIGLLSYKPHFGILIPVALAAGGYGRVTAAAAATVTLMALASWMLLGTSTWEAFVRSLAANNQAVMVDGGQVFAKFQTVFGIVRTLTGSPAAAWSAQALTTAACALGVAVAWRKPVGADTRSAALAVAALLATPYAFIYDLVVLAVPIAFLARGGLGRTEGLAIVLAGALVLVAPFAPIALAFGAVVVVTGLVVARACRDLRPSPERPGLTVSA